MKVIYTALLFINALFFIQDPSRWWNLGAAAVMLRMTLFTENN